MAAFVLGAVLIINEVRQAIRDPFIITTGLGLMGYTAIFGRKKTAT